MLGCKPESTRAGSLSRRDSLGRRRTWPSQLWPYPPEIESASHISRSDVAYSLEGGQSLTTIESAGERRLRAASAVAAGHRPGINPREREGV